MKNLHSIFVNSLIFEKAHAAAYALGNTYVISIKNGKLAISIHSDFHDGRTVLQWDQDLWGRVVETWKAKGKPLSKKVRL